MHAPSAHYPACINGMLKKLDSLTCHINKESLPPFAPARLSGGAPSDPKILKELWFQPCIWRDDDGSCYM